MRKVSAAPVGGNRRVYFVISYEMIIAKVTRKRISATHRGVCVKFLGGRKEAIRNRANKDTKRAFARWESRLSKNFTHTPHRAGTTSRVGPRPQVFCDANAHRVARRGKNTWGHADNVPALGCTSRQRIVTRAFDFSRAHKKTASLYKDAVCNAETQNRTADTAVFSRMLYQLSYLGVSEQSFYADSRECQKKMRDACPSPLTDKRRASPLRGYLPAQTPIRGDNRSKRRRRSVKRKKTGCDLGQVTAR